MSAPNIQTSSNPQVVTGGDAGTKLIGPTTVDGDLTVTGAINGGGGGGLAIAAAGVADYNGGMGSVTVLTSAVQASSLIFTQGITDPAGGATTSSYNIVPGVSFDIASSSPFSMTINWLIINP